MKYLEEIKPIVDRINIKLAEAERLGKIKGMVDDRTDQGKVTIKFENFDISVNPLDFKNLLDSNIASNDIAADLADLKLKAK